MIGDTYGTQAELKHQLSIADTVDDALVLRALRAASQLVEEHCRRQFNTDGVAVMRRYEVKEEDRLDVDDFQADSLESVVTGTLTWAPSDYTAYPIDGIQHGRPGWPQWNIRATGNRRFAKAPSIAWAPQFVEVTAVWGWEQVPAAIVEATMILAKELYKLRDTPYGVAGMNDFGTIMVRENPYIRTTLRPFRLEAVKVG